MGGLIRNAAAFGVNAVIVDGTSCNPWLRRSVRVSMGTIMDVEIIRVPDLPNALREMRENRTARAIGASLAEGSISLSQIPKGGNAVLVFGSEGWGLRREVASVCDALAEIPMSDNVDSLNVAVASGIFLYAFLQLPPRKFE
jgi:tRNA G18 (ribose-2'-O)-methylase SpoU